ncbi:CehA/McbA family metallohydrolase [Sphingomonas quercus]|uniref:CehA/McbA family metallohydrolase n=1 Tax=Sphingomonas quercus TaxID=2842451 RepID=A0ABS6BEV0_9SPHN|nr:CehA/McbA family metallohydrolase [Sphingomonas quercus]MBU3076831.1 CehA/McbA family metallohydrolase [Sphingomonas quercus]
MASAVAGMALGGAAHAQTRLDFHLYPAVSTGPLDPAWSPDGKTLSYAAQGDIWTIPVTGGTATALTKGPFYYSEPSYAPDGSMIAVTMEDNEGNYDIGIMPAQGGAVQRLTTGPEQDFAPAWSVDGKSIFYVTRRKGTAGLDIVRIDLATRMVTDVAVGPGSQYQPAPSPDGKWLAFVAPERGFNGSGSLWVMPLDGSGPARLVHHEESSYRLKPSWSADGKVLTFVSDAAGSFDIAAVPVAGGDKFRLTHENWNEFDPQLSPDGKQIAFVSNRDGNTELMLMDATGGAIASWRPVPITKLVRPYAMGTIKGRILDEHGAVTPARLVVNASDGRSYVENDSFHRKVPNTGVHYEHSDGTFEIQVPAGDVSVEALHGFEYAPADQSVHVAEGGVTTVELHLSRVADPAKSGWYGGDMHIHDLHEGRYGLTHEKFFAQLQADDVRVANALIHMDGSKIMGRWDDLTGTPSSLSNDRTLLRYSEEFRGGFGHVALVGVKKFVMPLVDGSRNTPYAPDTLAIDTIRQARAQGGIADFVHPYNVAVTKPSDGVSIGPVLAALGLLDSYDVTSIASLEGPTTEMYYRILNSGIRLPATGGTDNFSDVWFDPSGGTARAYAQLRDGQPLTFENWIAAIRQGRTFGTNGPLLFLNVGGAGPGDEIANGKRTATINLSSIAAVDTVDLVVNGKVVKSWKPGGKGPQWSFSAPINAPAGSWIAARASGPKSRYLGDADVFAQTSPVYVAGKPVINTADALFLADAVRALWARVEQRNAWFTEQQKSEYKASIDQAISYYENKAHQ